MKLRRYHTKMKMPENLGEMILDFFSGFDKLVLTNHARNEMVNDTYGVIPIPTIKDIHGASLIEVYEILNDDKTRTHKIAKILVRNSRMHKKIDYSYVISHDGAVISAWANEKIDVHWLKKRTRKKYFTGEDEQTVTNITGGPTTSRK